MKREGFKSAEDFLIQNSFQNYCAGTDKQCAQYWENYIEAHPDHVEQILEAKRLFFILNGSKKPLDLSTENITTKIESNKIPILFNLSMWWKIAAILVVFVSVSLTLQWYRKSNDSTNEQITTVSNAADRQTIYNVNKGERKKLKLADGTTVLLNAGSTLTIHEDFKKGKRIVFLNGEGFFDVIHNNSPFIVQTKDFNVKVLGTKFNVKSYKDDIESETSLIEGSIHLELITRKNEILALKPGEKLTVRDQENIIANKEEINKDQNFEEIKLSKNMAIEGDLTVETAWTKNRIEFHDETFRDIKSTLERWYNVDIQINNKSIQDYEFTAIFTTESIQEVLEALKKAKPFNYQMKGDKIMITK